MFAVSSHTKTASASKYLQQLCKHFGHKVPAEWTPEAGRVEFPFGDCRMRARDGALIIECETDDSAKIPMLRGVIDSHIKTFAFREDLTLQWREHAPGATPAE